jgi:hypothetical protein
MAFFEKLGNTISSASKEVVKKTKELSDTTKISMKINSEKELMQKNYKAIGEAYYKKYESGEIKDGELKELCDLVRANIEAIENYQVQIQEAKGVRICDKCNAEIQSDVSFCNNCGNKIEEKAPSEAEPIVEKKSEEETSRTQAGLDLDIIEGRASDRRRYDVVNVKFEQKYL